MEQGIKFIITGDTKQLDRTLKQSEQQLKRYEQNISNVQRSINQSTQTSQRYQRAIQNLNNQFRNGQITQRQYTQALEENRNALNAADQNTVDLQRELERLQTEYIRTKRSVDTTNKSIDTGGKTLQRFGRRGGSATSAVTSFSQVIQDAPFGIRGVANNIEQLTTQMIFLSRSAGGARGAFSAFISSMTGPAGILLAVSAVTSALVFFDQNSRKAADGVDELGDSADDTKGSIDELRKSVVTLGQAQLGLTLFQNDIVSVQKEEILTLRSLLAIARDETKSREERQRALNRINKDYKQYIDNVTLESASLDKAQKSIEDYNKSLSLENSIKETSESIFQKRRDLIGEETEARIRATQALQRLGDADVDEERFIADFIARETAQTRKELQGLEQTLQEFTSQRLQRVLPGDIADEIVSRPRGLTPIEVPITLGDLDTLDIDAVAKRAKSGGLKLVEAFDLIESGSVSAVQNIEASLEGLSRVVTPAQENFAANLLRIQEEAKIMSDVVSAGFNAMTQQIVQSLNTGSAVLDAIVSTFVGAIAEIIAASISQSITEKALSKAKIATEQAKSNANAITIATNFAASLGPGGAIALPGILASQLAIINAAFSGIQAFAQGGIVGGGQFTGDNIPIFVNSGERILTTQDQSLLTQFLRGNFGGTTNRMGDAGPIRIEGVLRGDNIRLSNDRATRRNRRFGSGING